MLVPKIRGVDRAFFAGSRVLGVLLCLVGVVMVVSTIARGGGPLALGVVLGILFTLLGILRLVLAARLRPGGR